MDAWTSFPGKTVEGHYNFSHGSVSVSITRIEEGSEGENHWIEIWTGGYRPSHRIMNPPTLVPDLNGLVEIQEPLPNGTSRIVRYRFDPLESVALMIARSRGGK